MSLRRQRQTKGMETSLCLAVLLTDCCVSPRARAQEEGTLPAEMARGQKRLRRRSDRLREKERAQKPDLIPLFPYAVYLEDKPHSIVGEKSRATGSHKETRSYTAQLTSMKRD
ncbi:hypothetical protein AAFF_G00412250 [Aldrovandia affinis]|uniref:Uncharacterized protein n=1 Tax=Aldrovandia affinis TaxID=143900 RepID=A0AAD7SBY9_9TELE|nr:hypothetical protein AAFF_G00412250 [Aldrovandia affinis]